MQLRAQPVARRGESERAIERGERFILRAGALIDAGHLLERLRAFLGRRDFDEVIEMGERAFGEVMFGANGGEAAAEIEVRGIERDGALPRAGGVGEVACGEPSGAELEEDVGLLRVFLGEKREGIFQRARRVLVRAIFPAYPGEREPGQRALRIERGGARKGGGGFGRLRGFAQQMSEDHLRRKRRIFLVAADQIRRRILLEKKLPEPVERGALRGLRGEHLFVTLDDLWIWRLRLRGEGCEEDGACEDAPCDHLFQRENGAVIRPVAQRKGQIGDVIRAVSRRSEK